MISVDYIAHHVRGVWRMAFGGGDWRADLDVTTDGVFRSFWAVALSAPFSVLAYVAARRAVMDAPEYQQTVLAKTPVAVLLTAEVIGVFVICAASVVALAMTAQAIHASKKAAEVIVAFNWAQLLGAAVLASAAVIFGVTDNAGVFTLLYLPALFFYLALLWGILRKSLPVTVGMTVSLIAMLILIKIIANTLVTHGVIGLYQLLA